MNQTRMAKRITERKPEGRKKGNSQTEMVGRCSE
jgi:hypothetical protein